MLTHLFVILLVVYPALGLAETLTISCGHRDAFRCANGECIYRYAWCDGEPDCRDLSDEKSCHGVNCSASDFQCKIGGCIPLSGVCDHYADCIDGSDEMACETVDFYQPDEIETVKNAATFFLRRMTENKWADFTPRAVVALLFADRASPISKDEKDLMIKELDIYLKEDLIHKRVNTLSDLAFSINALYATCQDPRNFQGKDLVGILRSRTNDAMKGSHFEYPTALLTLCIADQVGPRDLDQLMTMYWNNSIMSLKALVIMAMACIGNKTGNVARNEVDHFITSDSAVRVADVYTKALYLQAVHAAGFTSNIQLSNLQVLDGSFGDMLATYSAIPALLHSSLLNLRCNLSEHEGLYSRNMFTSDKGIKLTYSIWIKSDSHVNTHSMVLRFEGNVTFYDVMQMAAARDPLFRFLYDETSDGKKVYSLAGIPNDSETGKSWVLYEATADVVSVQTPHYLKENHLGVDKINIGADNHFIFWLKQ